jgi:hypothetical protein
MKAWEHIRAIVAQELLAWAMRIAPGDMKVDVAEAVLMVMTRDMERLQR